MLTALSGQVPPSSGRRTACRTSGTATGAVALQIDRLNAESETRPGARLTGFLVDCNRFYRILDGNTGAIDNHRLARARAARLATGDDFRQLGINIRLPHQPRGDGVIRVADRAALFEMIGHDFTCGHERGIDLLLVDIIRPDRRDEFHTLQSMTNWSTLRFEGSRG